MRKTKTILILCSIMQWCANAHAQTVDASSGSRTTARKTMPVTLSIFGGSQGVGGDVKVGVLKSLAVRAGGATLPVSVNNVFTFSDFNSSNGVASKFTNAHLFVDYSIFGGNYFRLVLGGAYFFKAQANFTVSPTGTYQYGEISLGPDVLGKANMNVDWSGVAPYAGISLFRGIPSNFFNINIDLGTYYLSSPKTTITGTGLLNATNNENEQLQQNMSSYKWLPVLQINFNFKL